MFNRNEFNSAIILSCCAVIFASAIYVNNPGDPYNHPDADDDVPTHGFLINSYGSDGYTDKYIYPYGNGYEIVNMSSFATRNPSALSVAAPGDKQENEDKMGFYNVQTGDEFFLNDFDVRPKFKTKKDNKHVLGYEYNPNRSIKRKGQVKPQQGTKINKPNNPRLGPNKNRRPQTNKNKINNRNQNKNKPSNTRRRKPTLQNNKKQIRRPTTRKPIVNRNKNTNNRKRLQQNKKKVQQNSQTSSSGCRNPNFQNKRPARKKLSSNRIKNRVTQNRKPITKLNKLNTNRKRYQNGIRRKDDLGMKQENNISNVIKKYMEKLKQNINEGTQTSNPKIGHPKQRSLFSMTLNQIRNQSINFANQFMSLFTVTQHPNYRCSADNAFNYYEGTCYTEKQCLKLGGTAVGDCSNFEKCCVFKFTCGESTSQNSTYFENPNYPEYFPKDQNIEDTVDDYADEVESSTDDAQKLYEDLPEGEETFTTPYKLEDSTTEDDFEASNGSNESPEEEDSQQSSGEIFVEDFTENIVDVSQNFEGNVNNRYKEYAIARDGTMAENFACTFKVLKLSENVQQMRIDFIDLELLGPDVNGDCIDEKLMITGNNLNVPIPILCGFNTGHHVYIDVSKLVGPLQISILSNDVYSKRYKIKISQLESPCVNTMNCLQYHVGNEGSISSFNYDQASILSRSDPGYLNNLNYAICIRRDIGYCSVTFSNRNAEDEYLFDIRNVIDGSDEDSNQEFGLGPIDCPNDFVVIDNMRICGRNFQTVTDTTSGPIVMIPVHTDEESTGIGFKLFYKQNRCTN